MPFMVATLRTLSGKCREDHVACSRLPFNTKVTLKKQFKIYFNGDSTLICFQAETESSIGGPSISDICIPQGKESGKTDELL